MRRRFHLLWMLSMCGAGLIVPNRAGAQTAPGAAAQARPSTEGLVAERQRLRAELTRVQAEIDQLKKGDRGLRADYQLRARLADAEAIAHRLTDLDEQIRTRSPDAAPRTGAPIGDEPIASPTDGPQELDAKADILTDQAHRVQAQAAVLKTRIDQVRGRRELRRRAHQLESDPFAPLEGSKRRLLTGGGTQAARPGDTQSQGPRAADSPGSSPTSGGAAAPPSTGLTVSTTPSTSHPITDTDATGTKTLATNPVQVHDQLDPGSLSPARKAGSGGAATNDLDTMEKELAALNARAQHLQAQAQTLRAKARGH